MEKVDVGLLFVHGIGVQTRGRTLKEFGEPILKWVESRYGEKGRDFPDATEKTLKKAQRELDIVEWSGSEMPSQAAEGRTLVGRVRCAETLIHDASEPEAPAHSRLVLKRQLENDNTSSETWLFAESWWAEQFAPPSYADLVKWSLGILPWVLGTHFASQIRRQWNVRPWKSADDPRPGGANKSNLEWWGPWFSVLRSLSWSRKLISAWARLGIALLFSVLIVPLLVLFLVVALLPIPQVRAILLQIQTSLASILGDSYVFLDRSFERASIIRQVRHDLEWLAQRCRAVAIVAHSQGGAIAHQAMRGKVPNNFRLLFTFGSGLRKLEELREVMHRGTHLKISAIITSIATFLFAFLFASLVLTFLVGVGVSGELWLGLAQMVILMVLVVAGIFDYLRGISLPHLEQWLDWLKQQDFTWVDCYASADPVPNGEVSPSASEQSRKIYNLGSMISDHTSYWQNRDEFASLLIRELSTSVKKEKLVFPELDYLAMPDDLFEKVRKRRRFRVLVGRATVWVGALAVATAIWRTGEAWWYFCVSSLWIAWGWVAKLLALDIESPPAYSVSWEAIGFLILALVVSALMRWSWNSWNRAEMQWSVMGDTAHWYTPIVVLVAIIFTLVIVHIIHFEKSPELFVFVAIFLFVMLPLIIGSVFSEDPMPAIKSVQQSSLQDSSTKTNAGNTLWLLFVLNGIAVAGWILGGEVWRGITAIVQRFMNGAILGFQPATVSPGVFGVFVAIFALCGYAAWQWKKRNKISTHS